MENLIHDLTLVNHKVDSLGMVFEDYVAYKSDDEAFLEHLKGKKEKIDDSQRTISEDSK